MRNLLFLLLVFIVAACGSKNEGVPSYPLLSLFDADMNLDGKEIMVTGYFGYWDEDIPVLYATFSDYKKADGLYKAQLIFSQLDNSREANSENIGEICTFSAKVWYRNNIPTLDNAALVKCVLQDDAPSESKGVGS